jgi:predicted nuclease of restriction endonuclease-like (RecB) superfamily
MNEQEELLNESSYREIVRDVKAILSRRRKEIISYLRQADRTLCVTYWEVGKRILRDELEGKARAGYGERLIPKLAGTLHMTRQELFRIIRFARLYPKIEDIKQELHWSHYRMLISISDEDARRFYEQIVVLQGWSKRELEEKISSGYYSKHGKDISLPKPSPLIPVSQKPQEYIQEIYEFPFLEKLKPNYSERDVEILINHHLREFLNELGPGFYIGLNQKNIFREDEEVYRLDWEAYSRKLRAVCVIDLKIGVLHDRDVAQMIRYLLHYDRYDRMEGENPAFGLILCEAGADKLKNYLVEPFNKRIFASQYRKRRARVVQSEGYNVYELEDCRPSGETI